MSLVNDALKRARQAQPAKLAPADGPPLRPVEPVAKSGGVEFMVGGFIAGVLLLAGMLFFMWSRGAVEVRARTTPDAATPQTAQATQPVSSQRVVATVTPVVARTVSVATTPTVSATPIEPAKPAEPVFKLQSVFYMPNHPSAMINGKTVRVGGVVNNARVVAIGQDSAILVTAAGEKKVLQLPND